MKNTHRLSANPKSILARIRLLVLVSLFFSVGAMAGTNYYWFGGAGNWNDGTHWGTATNGGGTTGTAPTSSDVAIFDASSGLSSSITCTVSAAATVGSVQINGGSIRIATTTTNTLTTNGDFQVNNSAVFYYDNTVSGKLYVGGAFFVGSSASILPASSGTWTIYLQGGGGSGNNISSANNTGNTVTDYGKINFTVNAAYTLNGNVYLNTTNTGSTRTFTINASGASISTSTYTFDLQRTQLVLTNGALNVNTGGTLETECTLASPITYTAGTFNFSGTVIYNGAAAESVYNTTYYNLTLNQAQTFTALGAITVNGTLKTTLSGTIFDMSTYQLSGGGSFAVSNTGIIKTSYVGASAIPAVSYGTTGTVQYAVSGQTVVATTYNNLTLTSNTTAASGTITLNGNWSNSGTFTPGTNTVTFSGGGAQSITGATTFYNLSTATSNTNLTVGSAITVSTFFNVAASTTLQLGAALTLSTSGTGSTGSNIVGTLQLNSGGSVVTNSPYYTSTSTLIYNTGATANVGIEWTAGNTSGQAGVPNNVQIGNGVASSAFSFNGSSSTYTMTGNLNITSNTGATLTFGTSGTATLNIMGSFTNSGTFTPVSGTVNFNGSSASQTFSTGQTFYGLTMSNASATVPFPAATTTTYLTIAASITQPVSTTIATANLTINTGITFTQSPASTASQSTNTAGSNNAVFNMNSGANTISIGNSGVLNINGWFKSAIGSGTITIGTGAAINVNSNAVYNCSGSGSNLPAATWATTSTLYFSGIAGSAPTMPTTVNTYGNIIWNCTGQTTTSAYIFPSGNTATTLTINNLIVLNTGTAAYLKLSNTATSNVTINVANIQVGSGTGYSFNGSSITTAASGVATLELYYNNSTATSPTISVSGNILVAGSVTNSATATLTTGYGCTLATQGSFTVNNDAYSVFTNTGINSGSISVTFNGTTNQTITGATTFGTINIGSSSLPASSVSLASSSTLTYNALTVYGNATLTTANSSGLTASSSSSTLTVNSSGKLIIGSGTTVTNSTTSSNTSIAGTLQMNGGSITTTPTYTSAGTLTYGSTATVGNEWGTGSTLATGAAQNVTINSGTITTGSTALYALGNLTISGGTLTLGGNLQVNGNWSDAGTLSGNYTVTFGGSNSNVTITNSNSGNSNTETFYGLTISNTNGVTLGSNVTVTDILTLSSAKLTTTGYVLNVKVATAGTSATSAATSTAYVNGPLTLTFPASTSGTATYNFPLGISNTFGLVNPSTGSGGTTSVTVQAYSSGNTAGFDATLASVSSGYWSYSTTGYFTSAKVALTSASVASNSVVADSVGGTSFTSYGGSVSSSTVTSSSNVNGATQYFALGVLSTTYYWVGGNGTWDNSTTTNWATASGGTGSTGVPGSNDRVVFDANSGATPQVTVAANISVKSLTFTNSPVVTFLFSTTSSPTAPITVGSLGLTLTGSTVVMGTGTTNATTAMGMGLTVNGPLLLQSSTSPAANSKLELCHYQASGSPTVTSNIFNGSVSTDVNNVLSVNSSSIAPQIQFTYSPTTVNSGMGNFYFDQTVSGGFALYKLLSSGAKQTIKLGNSINCGRLSLSSSSLASSTNPALDLNGNTLTTSSGTSTYTNGSIKADATGSSLVITTSIAFPLGASEFTPASIYSLTLNSATNDSLTLLQPLTITNLYLDSNTIINSTNNITIASGGTIYVQGGKLRAAPVLPSNVNIVVTGNCTSGYELPSTSTGTLQVNGGFTYTLAGNTTFGTVTTASSSSVLNLSTYTLGGSPTINNTGTIQTTSTSATPIPAVTYNGTVNYTASGGQTVVGTTYANLTLSNASGIQTAGGNITVNGTLTTTVGGTLDMSASNYSLTIGGTYTSGGTLTPRSGTVYFNGSSQSIPALNYYSLNLTSATGTLFPSGTVGIAGVFTPSSISSASQGTINFNGSSQSIPSFNYYNLSLASATGTLFPSGTVGIAGAFTPASITSASQGIINFNGTTNQTVPAFNYNSLTLGGTYTSTNNLTLASSGNIGIAGNFSATATFGTSGYIATSSTVNLNGTGTQTISSGFTFNTLNIYNGGVVIPITLTASNITIGDGTNTINLTQPAVTLITVTSAFNVSANATYTIAAGTGSSISAGTNNAVMNFNSASGTITNSGTIAINGWFTNGNQNSSTATTLTSTGTWTIGGQGVYNHNTINGTIPTMTSWVAGSTLYYTGTHGAGTIASGTNQSFRKVIYNCPNNSSSANYFNPSSIQDTLYVVNSGSSTPRTFQIENSLSSVSIGTLLIGTGTSSYYFNGGISTTNPVVVSLGTTTAPTITVAGDVLVQGNNSTNTAALTSSSGSSVLNIGGNLTVNSNATLTTTNISVTLNGTGTSSTPQTITSAGQTFTSLTVSNATYATLANAISVSGNLALTSGTLNDGGNTITVNGSITGTGAHTGSGLLLITGGSATHTIGASTGTINLGNVQVNSSSYIIGLAGNAVINGTLTLTSGLFNVYSYNLELSSTPVGYNSSSYIYHYSTGSGTLTINNVGSGATVFPVGISTNYVPITFTGTTNTPNITLGFGLTITNAPINSSTVVNAQWSILSSTSSSSNVTFQYNSNNQASGYPSGSTVVAGIYASGAYTETTLGSVSGSGPYSVSTTSAIALPTGSASLYVVGNQYSFAAGAPTPTISYLTGGNNQATLGFSAVSNGATITGYSITPYIGGTAQTPITGISSSPYTITGLTNGTAYTFTVSATNSAGTGTSASSNAVTIAVPTIYDSILTNRTTAIQLNTPSIVTSLISATYGYVNGGILSDSTFSSLGEPPTLTSPNKDLYYSNYLSLIQNMAEVYTYNYTYINGGVNKTGYNNPAVLSAIKKTLTWWLNRVPYYTCNNWHYGTITYPLNLGNVLVLMRGIGVNVDTTGWGTIEKNAINLVYANPETPNTGLIANGYLSPSTNTGDNRTNICDYWLDWGCLTKNVNSNGWDVVDTAINELYTTMDYTQSLPDGYKQDNSFMQHYSQDYTQQYGGGWAYDILAFGNYLKATSKTMTQTNLDLMYNYVHNSYYASARGIYKDFSLNGREISIPNNNLVDSTIAQMGALVDPTPSHITGYQTDLANCETSNPNYSGDTLHTHYFVSDYTLHKRPNYNFSVRSVSTRTNMDESLNTQNLLGTFLAQGATSIMVHGNENNNSFANWNWNYVPGVTTSDSLDGSGNSATQQNPNYGQYDTGYTRFVGGVSDGKYGASTLSLSYDHVTGNKSWFFFDSAVVCLGANIQSAKTGMNIVTSVNQQLINGPIYYNNSAGGSYTAFTPPTNATPNTVTGTNIYSVFHDSIGYFFPTGNNVTIKQDSVYGDWYNIDNLYISSIPDTTDMFQLSINHGVAPSNGSYQYIVAPGISYSTMQSYNPLNTISILANTKYVQAVKHNGLNMMQVIFDSATSITDPTSGITVKVNQPCALMLSNMNQNPLTVTVSDPTQLLSNLTVTMSYSSNASQFNVVNETLPSGYYVGSSVSFTVDSTTASATWVGTTNTSYNTASNWLANVAPTAGANITIAAGAPHYPVLNSSVATTINNMIISGGSFTVNSTDTLKVDSTIINTGGTVTVNGLVAYTGSSAQTIAANTFASNTVNNLRINNAAGVTLGGALNISGTLYPTSGTLTSAGYLTLLSSSAGTARVDNVYGPISGNVNVQRYISAKTARKFSFIGSPVAASIRSAWQQQIYITGAGTGGNACGSTIGDGVLSTDMYNSNGFDITPSGAASMFTYNATKINGSRYVSIPNTDQTNLVPGTGYILNIRGNRADGNCVNQLETGSPTAPDAVTLNATGTLTTGNLSATLYDTTLSKYTLLANPYPSQLSFSAFQTSNSAKVYNKMWTYSPFGSGNYTTYLNGIIANGATSYDNTTGNYIASGQAFFVEATQAGSAGTVTFNESHKTNGPIPNTQYFGATENKLIRISLQAASDSSLLDEVVVRFNSEGSAVYNPYADAHSFSAANQTLVSLKGTNRLAIATHPDIVDTDTTQLGISSKSTGAFRLLFSDYQALDNAKTITLIDNFLGTTQDVRANQTYTFNVTSDTASMGNRRFEIIIGGTNPLPVSFTSIAATKNTDGVSVNWSVANQLNIANYEVERSTDGSTFATIATTKATNASSYSTEDKSIPADANTLYYRIKSIGENGNFKYSNVALLKLSNIKYQLSIYPNPVQNKLNISLGTLTNGTYKVRIITVAGVEAFSKTGIAANGNTITINASNLASGVYMLELTDQLGNKQLEKFVKN